MNKYSKYIILILLGFLLISVGFNISSLFGDKDSNNTSNTNETKEEKVSVETKKLLTDAFPEDKYDYKDLFYNDKYYYTVIYMKGSNEIFGYYFVDVKEHKVFRLEEFITTGFESSFAE